MTQREKPRDPIARQKLDGDGGDGGTGLEQIRQAGADLLAVGDAAIRRALSGDSERFLQANRQHGGQ